LTITDGIGHIPPHTPQDDVPLKLTALEVDHAASPPPRDQWKSIAEYPVREKLRQNLGTMSVAYEPNLKSGTWSYCGMTVSNKGGGNTVNSQGTWEETGHLKFHHRGTSLFSDGRTCGVEFENDATSGSVTLKGKLYAWS
jgi:hypothetical protein